MAEKLSFVVPKEFDGKSAKSFLRGYCGISAALLIKLKREEKGITADGVCLRTVDILKAGQRIELSLPSEESNIDPVEGKLDIVFEDKWLLIVNKPPFMPVHPVKQHQTDTLANIVRYYNLQNCENYIFRAVNRLDRDTSGLVMICKDKFSANKLKNNVYKEYIAICHGKITRGKTTINAPIGLTAESKIVRHVLPGGQPSVTHYEEIDHCNDISLLKLWLETGRTHQIRCHMASVNHPLVGDDLYGGSREHIARQCLHCSKMSFVHPVSGDNLTVSAPIPGDMQDVLKHYFSNNEILKLREMMHKCN